MQTDLNTITSFIQSPWFIPLLIWILIWKGLALWRAAKDNSKIWFVALLILNTIGILEIIYLFIISKNGILRKKSNHSTHQNTN